MAVKPIIIPLVADTAGLTIGIEALEQLGAVDAKTAADFKAASKAFTDRGKAIDITVSSTEKLSKASQTLAQSITGGAITQATNNINKLNEALAKIPNSLRPGGASKEIESIKTQFVGGKLTVDAFATALELAKKKLRELDPASKPFQTLQNEIKASIVTNELLNKSFTSTRSELRAMREALTQLEEGGFEGTNIFQNLQVEAGKLDDQLGDTQARVKALASDTFKFDAAIQSIQGVAGAFSIAQGAAALFGDESDEVQQALLKVNAAMAILNGLQQLQNILQKQSTANLLIENALRRVSAASTVLQSLAESRFTVVRVLATGAQNALNAAMAANPAGVLLLAISAAAGALLLFANNSDKAADSQGELADQSRRVVEALNAEIDIQERLRNTRQGGLNSIRQEIAELQARGATRSQILALEGRALEEEIQNLKVRQQSLAENAASQDEFDKVSAEIAERQSDRAIKSIEEQKARADEGREITKKALEDQKKATQDFLKDQIAANEAALIESRDGFEKLVAQIALINAKLRLELANSDLGPNERLAAELRAGEEIKKARQDLLGDLQKVGQQETDFQNKKLNEQVLASAKSAQQQLEIELAASLERRRIAQEEEEEKKRIREQVRDATFNLAIGLSQSLTDIAKNQADAELAILQDQLDKGLISEEAYAARVKQIKRQQAIQEKQMALFQAVISTAAAVVKALPNIPLSVIVGILGAAQIAAIASRPIPAFKKGTKDAPGGLSLVGEAGAELIYHNGNWQYASKATVLDLPKHAKVIPAPETAQILQKYEIPIPNISQNVNTSVGSIKIDYQKLGQAVGKEVAKLPLQQFSFDENGIARYNIKMANRSNYLNGKFRSPR